MAVLHFLDWLNGDDVFAPDVQLEMLGLVAKTDNYPTKNTINI